MSNNTLNSFYNHGNAHINNISTRHHEIEFYQFTTSLTDHDQLLTITFAAIKFIFNNRNNLNSLRMVSPTLWKYRRWVTTVLCLIMLLFSYNVDASLHAANATSVVVNHGWIKLNTEELFWCVYGILAIVTVLCWRESGTDLGTQCQTPASFPVSVL